MRPPKFRVGQRLRAIDPAVNWCAVITDLKPDDKHDLWWYRLGTDQWTHEGDLEAIGVYVMRDCEPKVITLPCFDIVVDLGPEDPEKPGTFLGGTITSSLKEERPADIEEGGSEQNTYYDRQDAFMDAIESMVLAHACAGIDVASPAYVEGIETAVNAADAHL